MPDPSTEMISPAAEPLVESYLLAQPRPLSLRENFSWTLPGNIVYAGCQWGMLVVLAKLGSPEMVGQFALGLAVTAPLIIFSNLQLRTVQSTDAKREFLFTEYLRLRLITVSMVMLVIAGVVVVTGYRRETALVVLTVGIAKGFESISDIYYGLYQQHERMDRIAKSMLMKGPVSLLFFGTGVYLTGKVLWGAVGLGVAWLLILACYDLQGISMLNPPHTDGTRVGPSGSGSVPVSQLSWDRGRMKKLAWTAFPLGFVMLFGSLNANIPRYLIERYLGEGNLGIFSAMAYLVVVGAMVMNALWQSASPRLAKYHAEGKREEFRVLVLKLLGIGAGMGIAGILMAVLAGREILAFLYSPEYSHNLDVFIWLMVAAAVQYMGGILSIAVSAMRRFWIQAPINMGSVLLTILFSVILIPKYGLVGAAWSILFPYCFTRFAFCFVFLRPGRNTLNE